MTLTRRRFLQTTGATAIAAGVPVFGRVGAAWGAAEVDPATRDRLRLVVLVLDGGNDGLNLVAPIENVPGAPRRAVYEKVRPSIQIPREQLLRLDRPGDADEQLGLHPAMTFTHGLYGQGRLAIVQGVDYPDHSYSHATSSDAWECGCPPSDHAASTGWLGRHLDRVGVGEGEIRGVGVVPELPLILLGEREKGFEVQRLPMTLDDGSVRGAPERYEVLGRYADHIEAESLRRLYGRRLSSAIGVVEELSGAPQTPSVNGNPLAPQLLTARTMLEGAYGTEVVYLRQGGYDTHDQQASRHQELFADLDQALQLFYDGNGSTIGPIDPHIRDRTLIMVTSEFGRRIGENGAGAVAGTDHGAAAPVLIVGPPPAADVPRTFTGGLYGDHPAMGTVQAPADNLMMTTDMRTVYQTVLTNWLENPEPEYSQGFGEIPGLITGA